VIFLQVVGRSVRRISYEDLADSNNPLEKKDHIMRKVWMLTPHTGWKKIPSLLQAEVRKRINDYAKRTTLDSIPVWTSDSGELSATSMPIRNLPNLTKSSCPN
jgi:hypothetical protein